MRPYRFRRERKSIDLGSGDLVLSPTSYSAAVKRGTNQLAFLNPLSLMWKVRVTITYPDT